MTEQEAIEIIKGIDEVRGNLPENGNDVEIALMMAKDAIEEIKQYREFKKIFEEHMSDIAINVLSDQTEFGKWLDRIIWTTKKCDEIYRELEKYRELGTVEEIKDKLEQLQIDEAIISLPSDCVVCKEKKELEKYKALGTVKKLQEARKKQKAKKPYIEIEKATGLHEDYDCYECPNCDSFLGRVSDCKDESYRYDYCPNCGQAIDWSEEE